MSAAMSIHGRVPSPWNHNAATRVRAEVLAAHAQRRRAHAPARAFAPARQRRRPGCTSCDHAETRAASRNATARRGSSCSAKPSCIADEHRPPAAARRANAPTGSEPDAVAGVPARASAAARCRPASTFARRAPGRACDSHWRRPGIDAIAQRQQREQRCRIDLVGQQAHSARRPRPPGHRASAAGCRSPTRSRGASKRQPSADQAPARASLHAARNATRGTAAAAGQRRAAQAAPAAGRHLRRHQRPRGAAQFRPGLARARAATRPLRRHSAATATTPPISSAVRVQVGPAVAAAAIEIERHLHRRRRPCASTRACPRARDRRPRAGAGRSSAAQVPAQRRRRAPQACRR